jgi:hypothetical protein
MQMMRTIIATVVVALSATAAMSDTTTQTSTRLPACGSEAKNAFGAHKEYPAIDEGNGYVGFKTEDIDANGLKERYSLVNCATRTLTQIKAEYPLTNSSTPAGGDLLAMVDKLHKDRKIANEALFAGIAKGAGYDVVQGKLPKPYDPKAARSECGCLLYYPETRSLWVK